MKKVVAIIPARGGSKGIPGKNIINFSGHPLLSWTIGQVKNSKFINEVYVSSDSDEILSVAKGYGAKAIKRPAEISDDMATSESCLLHFLEQVDDVDIILFLQATSPLRETKDIDNAINKFIEGDYDSMFSATELEDFFIWTVDNDEVESYNYDYKNRKRRQDISGQIVENGSFYLFKPEVLYNFSNRLGGKIGFSLMEGWKIHEIDNKEDLMLCEYIFKQKGLNR